MNNVIRFMKKIFLYLLVFLLASCGASSIKASTTKSPVLFVTPSNSATNVSLTTNFSVGFNTPINPKSLVPGSAFLIEGNSQQANSVAKSKAVGSKINLEVQAISTGGKNVAFKLPAGTSLNSQTQYQFSLDLNKITASNGASFGSGTLVVSTFSTQDTTVPVATIVSPANGLTGVRLNPNIQVAFSEKVLNVNTSTIILHQGSVDGTSVPISITNGSNNVYVFTPTSNLVENTSYYLTLSNSITDTASPANNLAPTTFTFTTGDFTAPTVTLLTPSNGQNNVSTSPSIQFIFNEAVVNVNQTTVTLHSGSATGPTVPIGTIIAGSNNTYTFSPASNLSESTTYYIVLSNGITDTGNPANNLAPTIFTFTTGDFTAPTVSITNPVNGSTGASATPTITLVFSEAVNNVNSNNVTLYQGSTSGSIVSIGNIVQGANNTYTFRPVSALNQLTAYYVVIGSGITDNYGNHLVQKTFSFTTGYYAWTWVSGSNTFNQSGVYGTQGVASTTNIPGARELSISWTDSSGNLWLFGGSYSVTTYLNDLWKYSPAANTWTWVSGSNIINQAGVYGTQGVASTANIPGARTESVSWIDSSGNLWLFGGHNYNVGYFNDLWKYNPTNNTWTWVNGSNTVNQAGVYGTQGVASTANIPGSRYKSISWIDSSGNLWLFGGIGNDSVGSLGDLNDLWKYNPNANTWTWVSGSNIVNQAGVYGTIGVASTTNIPGAREQSISWIDSSGNLWLFGGWNGFTNRSFNDLWKYNPTNNTWTWVSGSNTFNQSGIYGTKGVASSTNIPGARRLSISWIDSFGNLWLFGGFAYDSTGNNYQINDLWEYNPSANTWTWVSGSNQSTGNPNNAAGIYGTQGVASTANVPGGRFSSISWIDQSGNLWLFGGYGMLTTPYISNDLNDLWKFSVN